MWRRTAVGASPRATAETVTPVTARAVRTADTWCCAGEASRGGEGAGVIPGAGATATTGAADISTAPDTLAASAPLPASATARDGPA